MTAHLFIGGPADGRTMDVPDRLDHFRVSVGRPDPEPFTLGEPIVFGSPEETAGYRRERFAVGKRIAAEIFVYQHFSTDMMFQTLIEGYRQGIPVDPGEAYETGFKNGARFGVLSAVKAIEADNPQGNAPMWNVFRDRCVGLIKGVLK